MIAIAESGSTKCDWLLFSSQQELVTETSTAGFNPYFHSGEWILQQLQRNPVLSKQAFDIDQLYFFGAGCSDPTLNQKLVAALDAFFQTAIVSVDHDLLAAAYATYDGRSCISCILGTGSNACFFDGQDIYQEVPSLAYILGDEGSGSYYGKKLLAAFFYKQLPKEIEEDLRGAFPELSARSIIRDVYQNEHANVYLASFMPFIARWRSHPMIRNWIKEGMDAFLKNQVACYSDVEKYPVHFVGSIAKIFETELLEAMTARDLQMGQVVKQPAKALADFVFRYLQASQ